MANFRLLHSEHFRGRDGLESLGKTVGKRLPLLTSQCGDLRRKLGGTI